MKKAIINEEEAKKEIQEFIGNSGFSWLIENVEEIENKDLSNFKEKKVYPMNIPYDVRESLERSGSWENFVKNQVLDSAKKEILRDLKKEIIEVICEEKNYVNNAIHKLTEENEESILNSILEELIKRDRKNLFLIADSSFWNEAEIKSFRNKEILEKINKIRIMLTENSIRIKNLKNNNFLFILVSKKEQAPIVPYHILGIKNEQDASSLNTYFFFHVWYGKKLDKKPLNASAFIKKKDDFN